MSEPNSGQLLAAALYAVPALLWAVMAQQLWSYLLYRHPRHRLFRVLPAATTAVALYFGAALLWALLPPEMHADPASFAEALSRFIVVVALGAIALLRHGQRLVPPPPMPPSRAWLVFNYVSTALVAAIVAAPELFAGLEEGQRRLIARVLWFGWMALLGTLCLLHARERGRGAPIGWGPGGRADVRRPDSLVIALTLFVGVGGALFLVPWQAPAVPSPLGVGLEAAIGILGSIPIAVRMLGPIVRRFLVGAALAAATAAVWFGHVAVGAWTGAALTPIVEVLALVALVLVLGPGHAWLRERVDRLISGRNRRRREALHAALHDLSPERGVLGCCEAALAEAVGILGVRGAGIVLGDGRAVSHDAFDVEPLLRAWPRGQEADRLPRTGFGTAEMLDLPPDLLLALGDAEVGLGVFPIIGSRVRWGHLFLSANLLDAIFASDDLESLEAFAHRLALVLDAADLLARAVGVERSLAHAEKLAAIGETSARIAHQIRNPVAAARSLAQQLAREPGGAYAEEHGLILAELERVELLIRDLLRFARRDDLAFGPVDLAVLVADTLQGFRPRLAERHVAISLALDDGVSVRADAEKTRQALATLIENAIDALDARPERRELALTVAAENACGRVEVADNGPGVPDDALPRLFEPFFSLKPAGTGLGLAIAKRIADALQGNLSVARRPGGGAVFTLELPIADGGKPVKVSGEAA